MVYKNKSKRFSMTPAETAILVIGLVLLVGIAAYYPQVMQLLIALINLFSR